MQTKLATVIKSIVRTTEAAADQTAQAAPVELDLSTLEKVAGGAPNATWGTTVPGHSALVSAPNATW